MAYKNPPKEYQFKKGEVANPNGRPKGKTMKEFAREFLLKMSDDEKVSWLKSLGKDIVWRMAEGNPAQDITSDNKPLQVIIPQVVAGAFDINDTTTDTQTDGSNTK